MMLLTLVIGRSPDTAWRRICNAVEMNPDTIVVCNLKFPEHELNVIKSHIQLYIDSKRVYINDKERRQSDIKNGKANLLDCHIQNYKFAIHNNLQFTHIYFISDGDFFIRTGLYDFIKDYHVGGWIGNYIITPVETNIIRPDWDKLFVDPWYSKFYKDPRFMQLFSEQCESSFYCKELFQDIINFLDQNYPDYDQCKFNAEEATFHTIYRNLFMSKYPKYSPIVTIYRGTITTEIINKIIEKNMPSDDKNGYGYDAFNHSKYFGVKRIIYPSHLYDYVISRIKHLIMNH